MNVSTPFASYRMENIPRAPDGDGADKGGGGADKGAGAGDGGAGADKGAGTGGADKGAGGGGGDAGPWWKKPDYKFDNDTLKFFDGKNYPDETTALSSLRHADQIARDRNVLPKPDPAKLNDWEGWETLGWQKDPAKYLIQKPELKNGATLDEAMFQTFTKDAHELRIPLGAAQELFKRQFDKASTRIAELSAAGARSSEDLATALKSEWGTEYDGNVEMSKRAMRALGVGMDDSAELEKMLGSPRLVKLFHGLSGKIGEDTLVDGGQGGIRTPQAARAERLRLEGDPDWMKVFNDPRNPRNKDFTAQRQRLIEIEAKT